MRSLTRITTVVLALSAAACAGGKTESDDFKRDLELASATNMDLAAPAVNAALLTSLETATESAPKAAKVLKKAPEAAQAVQSEEPTVEATPEPEPAPVQEEQAITPTPAPAPVPEEVREPVAVAPRPQSPPVTPAGGIGAGDYGRGGGVFGGGIGVVIRGGGVGGDNCEIHRPRGGIVFRSPVYVPQSIGATANGTARTVNPRGVRVVGGR